MIKINKSSVSTSQNYGINSFEFDENLMPKQTQPFENVTIKNEIISQEMASSAINNISNELDTETKTKCNFSKKYIFDKDTKKTFVIEFDLKNQPLVDALFFEIKKNVRALMIV